jgi:hypothetical protein
MQRSHDEENALLMQLQPQRKRRNRKKIIVVSGSVTDGKQPLLLVRDNKVFRKIPKDYFLKKLRKGIKKVGDKIGDTKAFTAIRNTKAYQKIGKPLLKVGVPMLAAGGAGLALGKLAAGKGLLAKGLSKLKISDIAKPKQLVQNIKKGGLKDLVSKGKQSLKQRGLDKLKSKASQLGIDTNQPTNAKELIEKVKAIQSRIQVDKPTGASFMSTQQTALSNGREMDNEMSYPEETQEPKVAMAGIGANLNFKNPLVIGGVILAAILLFGGFKTN